MREEIISKVLFDEESINRRVAELGEEITHYYQEQGVNQIVVIGILHGAVIFLSDLVRKISLDLQLDFMRVSSYGDSAISSGQVIITKDIETDIKGKHVLIVEDIIDTGNTLRQLTQMLYSREPASIRLCAFLDKEERRTTNMNTDFCGYVIPDEFVVGYGLDYAGKYRQLPFVGVLNRWVYEK